jgi:hypothetical protein
VSWKQPAYLGKLTTFPSNVTIEWLAFLFCIEQVLGPNVYSVAGWCDERVQALSQISCGKRLLVSSFL